MKTALTIAGSDCSGGAGIQADLKTFAANGVYGMSAITALTAQNTTGVYDSFNVPTDMLAAQLDCIFTDIFPDSVKIGMVASPEAVEIIYKKLTEYNAKNIVLDPVMVATSGAKLSAGTAVEALKEKLFSLADLITPNIPEAIYLSGIEIKNEMDTKTIAELLGKRYGVSVLIKGGHLDDNCNDCLYTNGELYIFEGHKINNPNTHGTGCTLSSAIAANLAKGCDLYSAIKNAKDYITSAIEAGLNLGKGSGPLMHNYQN